MKKTINHGDGNILSLTDCSDELATKGAVGIKGQSSLEKEHPR